jgi:hypothetical protein
VASLIPATRLADLNAGRCPSSSLMEVIAVDQPALFASTFPEIASQAGRLKSERLLERMAAGGDVVWQAFGKELWTVAGRWNTDTARGWAAMSVGRAPDLDIRQRLALARMFALDSHWAVREWAWLGVRDHIVNAPHAAIRYLTSWAKSRSPYLHRHPQSRSISSVTLADALMERPIAIRSTLSRQLAKRRFEEPTRMGLASVRHLASKA